MKLFTNTSNYQRCTRDMSSTHFHHLYVAVFCREWRLLIKTFKLLWPQNGSYRLWCGIPACKILMKYRQKIRSIRTCYFTYDEIIIEYKTSETDSNSVRVRPRIKLCTSPRVGLEGGIGEGRWNCRGAIMQDVGSGRYNRFPGVPMW